MRERKRLINTQKLIRSSLKGFVCEGSLYLACFLLIRYSFLRVVLRFSHVVGRLFDVVFDLVDHLALQEAEIYHTSGAAHDPKQA